MGNRVGRFFSRQRASKLANSTAMNPTDHHSHACDCCSPVVDRRHFLKSTAATALGASLGGAFPPWRRRRRQRLRRRWSRTLYKSLSEEQKKDIVFPLRPRVALEGGQQLAHHEAALGFRILHARPAGHGEGDLHETAQPGVCGHRLQSGGARQWRGWFW